MSRHDDKIAELISHEAATFILREATSQSLITVTRTLLSKTGDRATVLVTVFPQEAARPALSFLSRVAGDFREYLSKRARIYPLPRVEFAIDEGELNRQHLDEISKKS
jgi:ribosome-binding factor A